MENTANPRQKSHRLTCAALVGLLSCIAISLTFAFLQGPEEPEYKGRTLTAYLDDIRSGTNANEAVQAVQQIGTNALPHLEALLRAKDSPIKKRALDLLSKQRLIDSTDALRLFYTGNQAVREALDAGVREKSPDR